MIKNKEYMGNIPKPMLSMLFKEIKKKHPKAELTTHEVPKFWYYILELNENMLHHNDLNILKDFIGEFDIAIMSHKDNIMIQV